MTPRVGVKTTPAIETRLPGLPIPSGSPIFSFLRTPNSTSLVALKACTVLISQFADETAKTDLLGSAQFTFRVTAMRA